MDEIVDMNGKPLRVGMRVLVGDDKGYVEQISDPDGDVDDYGRSIYYPPRVTVRFEDGSEDAYVCQWTAMGPWDEDAPHACEDVEVDTSVLPYLTNCDPGDETRVAA